MPQITRRTFFKGLALASIAAAGSQALIGCTQKQPLRKLPIPPLLAGTQEGNKRHFQLVAQQGESQILPDKTTTTWGFNGAHLGPTLIAKKGEEVHLAVKNELDEMTTVHWHGMKLPARADGGPHSPIEPGTSWEASWTVANAAASLWYHPHTHGLTGLHAYRGLAGMFIIEDDTSAALDLPSDYGVDDIPLVLMDHRFLEDGSLDERDLPDLGLLGDTPTVNGITGAEFQATMHRVRLRILNGSNMRFFKLQFSDKRSFDIIASDAGFLPEPFSTSEIALGPGERWEIVVELEPAEEVTLESIGFKDNFGVPTDKYTPDFGMSDHFELLSIIGPDSTVQEQKPLPGILEKAETLDIQDAPQRSFVLNTFSINDQMMDMQRVDEVIDHQGPEAWTVTNDNSDWPHNFHIHNARFQVLSLDNTEVELFQAGWKDTVALPPGASATLAVEFGYYPDPQWPYMYHCHMLYHEDQGMMGQFVIVEQGQQPAATVGAGATHNH